MSGRVAAIQVRQDIRVPEDGPAVDEHESARMLSKLETGALELDESLEGFKGRIEPRRKLRGLVVPSRGERGVHERRIDAEVDDEDIRGAGELLHRAQIVELGYLQGSPEPEPLDRRCEHPLENGVGAHVADRRVGGRDRERVGDEGQDMARVVRQLEGHPGGVGRRSRAWTVRNRGDQGGGEARSGPLADRHLLELDVGEAPRVPLSRQLGPIDLHDEPIEIVRDLPRAVVDGVLAVVVAVVPGEALSKALDRAAVEEHPPAQVRVDVIAEQHLLVEPVDCQEVLAKDQLKIAGRIETDPLVAHGRLVQPQARAEALDLCHRAARIAPRQPFPEPLGELEPGQAVEPVGKVSADRAQALIRLRQEDHVRVRREEPAIRGVRAAHARVSGHGLDRGKVRASGKALRVDRGGHTNDPEQSEAAIRQRVGKGLDERR